MSAVEGLLMKVLFGMSLDEFKEFKKLTSELLDENGVPFEYDTVEEINQAVAKSKRLLSLAEKRNEILLATLN